MLISLAIILAIASGGFALTYLIENDEPFLWRLAAGSVIGSAIFGTASFVIALAAGLNIGSVAAALILTLLPILLVVRGSRRRLFDHDRGRAIGKMQGANLSKGLRALYYIGFLILFCLFFSQAMYETDQGIFTGGSNNLGDLPFHLGAILSFTDGANFPPVNPSWAGAKFSYPFLADLLTACFMKLGAPLREAMVVQNVAWAFALLVVLERFVLKLTGDRLSSKLAAPLLFFSGGLGFIWFLGDFGSQGKGLVEFLGQIPKDYTIGAEFRWGNSLITLFLTQRSLLLGMPLTLIVLGVLWKTFITEKTHRTGEGKPGLQFRTLFPVVVVGLLAGLLPLIHLHSLVVLFVVTGVLFFLRLDRWQEWLAFGAGVCMIAVPQLLWSMSGSATESTKFFEWHFGWDSGKTNILWFWLKNTGIFIPLIALGIYFGISPQGLKDAKEERKEKGRPTARRFIPHAFSLLLFYVPFVILFVISNIAKLAPWEWDNIKVLIYWFVGSLPFVTFALSWLWNKSSALKAVSAACFVVLIFSGSLDVLRTITGTVRSRVFDSDAVKLANRVKGMVPPTALFLNAPTYNSAVVLTGRQSLMRYPGHLASHGIDYGQRESDVKIMYAGGPQAEELIRRYGIDYVLVSPEERSSVRANEVFFNRFPVLAEVGQYKIYKIK